MMTDHLPLRPTWQCLRCETDWPCPTRRRQLQAEFLDTPVSLGLYLSSCLADAIADLPGRHPGALYVQLLGWLRHDEVPPMPPIPSRNGFARYR